MIVFTLVNKETDDVWVGSAREGVTPEERLQQFQDALALGIDHPFYKELKVFGKEAFSASLFAVAEDRLEMQELLEEALDAYNGKSLAGIKTVKPGTTKTALAPKAKRKPSSGTAKAAEKSGTRSASSKPKPVKEKLATGRTGSAARERAIKAGIEAEKAKLAAAKEKKIREEADEMKAILAGLDARGSTLSRR
ncbi:MULTISPECIES: GIY-YIG nuclease family protein [Microbulbifer]|uniref:Uncharacterized protein n=1 Tax=Microbulbifer celer TaxID=435905 RepID=A0ABW3UEF4_9GAMM|nr:MULTISPECIES: hypothetical protein [Microbulbifer]UFN59019.1 hypothetical protein LPW13_08290 [Microbulbifer celer]